MSLNKLSYRGANPVSSLRGIIGQILPKFAISRVLGGMVLCKHKF